MTFIPDDQVVDDVGGSPGGQLSKFIPDSSVVDDEQLDTSFEHEALGVKNRLVEGGLDLFSLIGKAEENLNPFRMGGPSLFGLNPYANKNSDQESAKLKKGLEDFGILGEEQPNTTTGKVLGEVASYAPSVLIPGGTLAGRAASAVLGGAAAGGVKAGGGGETAQGVAGLFGALSPIGAGKAASIFANAGDDFERAALNIQRSDLKKADKFSSKATRAEQNDSTLIRALEGAKKRGIFSEGRSPQVIIQQNEKSIKNIGDEATNFLKSADEAQIDVTIPSFDSAKKFIASDPWQAETLSKQFEKRMATLNDAWDGSISGLNKLKQQLYNIGYDGLTDSKGLDRAIAFDLKTSIESQVASTLGDDAAKALKKLNAQQGEHLTLRDLFDKNKYQDEMPGGIAKALRRTIVSPMGGAVASGAVSALTGSPLPVIAGIAGAGATTRTGQFLLSDASRKTGKALGMLSGSSASGAVPALADLTSDDKASTLNLDPVERAFSNLSTKRKTMDDKKVVKTDIPGLIGSNTSSWFNEKGKPSEALLNAVKHVESADGKFLLSPAGAEGPYQLMPKTSKHHGVDPYDEEQARGAAAAELAQNFRILKDPLLAVAAYNLGVGNVRRLLEDGASFDDIFDYLPEETQKYLPKIMKAIKT